MVRVKSEDLQPSGKKTQVETIVLSSARQQAPPPEQLITTAAHSVAGAHYRKALPATQAQKRYFAPLVAPAPAISQQQLPPPLRNPESTEHSPPLSKGQSAPSDPKALPSLSRAPPLLHANGAHNAISSSPPQAPYFACHAAQLLPHSIRQAISTLRRPQALGHKAHATRSILRRRCVQRPPLSGCLRLTQFTYRPITGARAQSAIHSHDPPIAGLIYHQELSPPYPKAGHPLFLRDSS